MFGIITWHADSFLTASMAVQLIAKLTDYTKNNYAETYNKELGRVTPEALVRYELEEMLKHDATRVSVQTIIRQYVTKRQLVQKVDAILDVIIEDEDQKKAISEFLEQSALKLSRQNQNESILASTFSDVKTSSKSDEPRVSQFMAARKKYFKEQAMSDRSASPSGEHTSSTARRRKELKGTSSDESQKINDVASENRVKKEEEAIQQEPEETKLMGSIQF